MKKVIEFVKENRWGAIIGLAYSLFAIIFTFINKNYEATVANTLFLNPLAIVTMPFFFISLTLTLLGLSIDNHLIVTYVISTLIVAFIGIFAQKNGKKIKVACSYFLIIVYYFGDFFSFYINDYY